MSHVTRHTPHIPKCTFQSITRGTRNALSFAAGKVDKMEFAAALAVAAAAAAAAARIGIAIFNRRQMQRENSMAPRAVLVCRSTCSKGSCGCMHLQVW
jgi:hypothetical protein